ncbi:MAG: peroxide stress protein YaaA [Oscillospiraceae bacterium]
MLAILSPAKNMRCAARPGLCVRPPRFASETARLANVLKSYAAWELESLLRVNPGLALRAFTDFQDFDLRAPGTPALTSYFGLAFTHLGAQDFNAADMAFADGHLRILSALYGSLRPSDGIQPYRLEMQSRLKIDGKNLYGFWGDKLYRDLFKNREPVVCLASNEYAKAVTPFLRAGDRLITCTFLTPKRGRLVTLATAAKMARGGMARFIVQNRVEEPEALRQFEGAGFVFSRSLSSGDRYVYVQE